MLFILNLIFVLRVCYKIILKSLRPDGQYQKCNEILKREECELIPCTRIISHLSNIIVSDNYIYFISFIDFYCNKDKSKFVTSVNY